MTYQSHRKDFRVPAVLLAEYPASITTEQEIYRTPTFADIAYRIDRFGFVIQGGATDANVTVKLYDGEIATGTQLQSESGGSVERNLRKVATRGNPLTVSFTNTGGSPVIGALIMEYEEY